MAMFNSYKDFITNTHEFEHTNINTFEEDIYPGGMFVWLKLERDVDHDPIEDTVYASDDQLIWEVSPIMWDGTIDDGYRILTYKYKVDGKEVTAVELEKLIRERIKILRDRIENEAADNGWL